MVDIQNPRFSTSISVDENVRIQLIDLMNSHIATLSDLFGQTKQAHWNVRGTDFQQFHELFDDMAGILNDYADVLAERIGAFGGYAVGTVREAAVNSMIPDFPYDVAYDLDMVEVVASQWSKYSDILIQTINKCDELRDFVTQDIFIDISKNVDKYVWFLESHMQD